MSRLAVSDFVADDALSRGASIAYFTLFSLAPTSLVVIAVAGLLFGRDAAQGATIEQLSGMMERDTAQALEAMIRSASDRLSGTGATLIGLGTIVLTVSGMFGEVQTALKAIWKAHPKEPVASRLVHARLASLGLVIAFGFVLAALSTVLNGIFPALEAGVAVADFVVSFALLSALFAAMYKVLPDIPIDWRDVAAGPPAPPCSGRTGEPSAPSRV